MNQTQALIESAVEKAINAFWEEIQNQFPYHENNEGTSKETEEKLKEAALTSVNEWINPNE